MPLENRHFVETKIGVRILYLLRLVYTIKVSVITVGILHR